LISICLATSPQGKKRKHHWENNKNISVWQPHQTNIEQAGPKEGKQQLAPLDIKQKGCTCTNEVGDDPKRKF
jgi:hypothetical protein